MSNFIVDDTKFVLVSEIFYFNYIITQYDVHIIQSEKFSAIHNEVTIFCVGLFIALRMVHINMTLFNQHITSQCFIKHL